MLTFSVHNHSATSAKFCKWHTPFEGLRNDIFEIRNDKDDLIDYHGEMAKRVTQAPPEDYIHLEAGSSTSAVIDLTDGYKIISPGIYTVIYTSGPISSLKSVNQATFSVISYPY